MDPCISNIIVSYLERETISEEKERIKNVSMKNPMIMSCCIGFILGISLFWIALIIADIRITTSKCVFFFF